MHTRSVPSPSRCARPQSVQRLAALTCGLALAACGGDSVSPTLSNLSYSPQSAVVGDGGGAMAVSVSMDFDDPAADLAQIVITTKDASGTSLGTTTAALTNPAGQRKGTLHGLVNCGTAVAGTFELGFHVVDSAGHASNVLTAHFAVTPGGSSSSAPALTSLSPSSIAAGGAGFTLVVNGSGFAAGSVVLWNGSARPTTYLGSTTLQAQISAADVAQPGSESVTVSGPNGTSGALAFVVTSGQLPGVTSIVLGAKDLVFDPYQQKLYVTVPSTSATYPNTIAVVDPFAGAVVSSVFGGSDPGVLAISDDGQFLYSGVDGAASFRRWTLPALAQDITVSLGQSQYYGPNFALDLAVAPGAPHTVAVSIGNKGVSPSAEGGIAVYDDATARATRAPGFGGTGYLFDSIQWGRDASAMYAANSEDTGFDFYQLSVTSAGVSLLKDFSSAFDSFSNAIHFDPVTGFVYADEGHVLDPATGLPVGTFSASGRMVPDPSLASAFFVSGPYAFNGTTVTAFDLTHFTSTGSLALTGIAGARSRVVRWGPDGLAFVSNDAHLVLVRGAVVLPVSATPNPSPTVASFTPASVAAGSGNVKLSVIGSGFVPGSVARWNGSDRTTRYVSPAQLTVFVPGTDLASAGAAQVTVVNPLPGGGASSAVSYTVSP